MPATDRRAAFPSRLSSIRARPLNAVGPGRAGAAGRRVVERTNCTVLRVGDTVAHLQFPAWIAAITVPVMTSELVCATGLSRAQLLGARLSALAWLGARMDCEVGPHGWQVVGADGDVEAA